MENEFQVLRVLVVEDSALSRKLVEHALDDPRYKLEFAKDGREAIARFSGAAADIVITDWELPDITGIDLCRKIRRALPPGIYAYVIVLTSNSDKASVSQGLAAGADDYVTKPFDAEELRARVGVGRRIIEMHRELEVRSQRLLHESRTDPLTGLANRRAIEEWAVKQIAGATRHGFPLCLILAEVDSYHQANDLFGRTAGDAMLVAFAAVLKRNTRASDICGHFGGAQFIVVLSHVDVRNAEVVLDRIRQQFEGRPSTVDRSATAPQVSFGIASANGRAPFDLDSLMHDADAALREAKGAVKAKSEAKNPAIPHKSITPARV